MLLHWKSKGDRCRPKYSFNSPRDLKSSVPANLPSKNTVLFSVLNIRLIRTRTTSIDPNKKERKARTEESREERAKCTEL